MKRASGLDPVSEFKEKKKKLIEDVFSWDFSGKITEEDINFVFGE